ncbi:hypothetical protein tb265_46080 [Gemmatimonadetes bacterium T265]|nr:hypothetical protein tb265_46080 [Gemmatimonadetes bacterium T265]
MRANDMRVNYGRLSGYIAAAGLLAACGASRTHVTNSWRDPSVGAVRFRRVLAVCACRDAVTRRTVEDRLAADLPGAEPSYRALAETAMVDTSVARAAATRAGFDGAVVVRLISVDKSATYVPGQAYAAPVMYGSLWGGWGVGYAPYGVAYTPGYVRQDQLINIDTNVYTLPAGRLVWASRSQTQDPASVTKTVDEVVQATAKAMRQEGMLSS